MTNQTIEKHQYGLKDYLKFIIPSLFGILLLMVPIQLEEGTTIFVAMMSDKMQELLFEFTSYLIVGLITISSIGAIITYFAKPKAILESELGNTLFNVSLPWVLIRFVGLIFGWMILLQVGPYAIIEENTGGLILFDLAQTLFTIFLFAGFFLSVLTDFGILEYVGVHLTPLMRPVFKLPGRSAVDALASWVGDGTIGVALTNTQYEEGYYTAKESAIIATTFSAVSITFCLVVLSQVGLQDHFGVYYLTVSLAGIVAAMIVPRIPPLSTKPNTYMHGKSSDLGEDIPHGYTRNEWAVHLAVSKAEENLNLSQFIKKGVTTFIDLWIGVLPTIVAIGTFGLIIAEYTQIFQTLGRPFLPLLQLLQVPDAAAVSNTIVVGLADMFLPTVIGANIPSDMARFIVAALSVTQLVYLSEVGAVILGTNIPVTVTDLFIIFIERTLVTLPIIVLAAKMIF